ncbi:MAG: GAF domain-containing protein [Anaerolineae bacterium]|nr:GAF domain-containing protein [Anaerolineae bacterium]
MTASPVSSALPAADEKQRRTAEAVRALLVALTASLDIDQVMQQILDAAVHICSADSATIMLLEKQAGRAVYLKGFRPEREEAIKAQLIPQEFYTFKQLAQAQYPFLIHDTAQEPAWVITEDTASIRSAVGILIQSRDQVFGVLTVDSQQIGHFAPSDLPLLQDIARCAALALENHYQVSDLEQKVMERTAEQMNAARTLRAKMKDELEFHRNLTALHEITIELTTISDLDTFFRRAVELGHQRLGFARAALFLYDPESGQRLGTYSADASGQLSDRRTVAFSVPADSILDQAFNSAERFSYSATLDETAGSEPTGAAWSAAAVLLNGTERLGWILVDSGSGSQPATPPMLETLALYSRTVGALLAQKRVQLELHRSEWAHRMLAENINDLVFRFTAAGQVSWVSPSSTTLLGETPEEFLANVSYDRVHPEDSALLRERITTFVEHPDPLQPTLQATVRYRHHDGHYIWLEMNGKARQSPETGEVEEVIFSARDISERKRAEAALRSALERERELNDLKSRFVAMASHEFRTPLAVILSSAEMVASYRQRMDEKKIDDRLHKIVGQVNYLTTIMDNMLELSRLGSGGVDFKPLRHDLDAACRTWIDEIRAARGGYPVEYVCSCAVSTASVDQGLLRIAVLNLIANAILYSIADQPVTISLECDEQEFRITVHDTGMGIPEADQAHLFEPFYRGANVGGKAGAGLGLSVTKEVMDMHSGAISFSSTLGVGSTFVLHLPRARGE